MTSTFALLVLVTHFLPALSDLFLTSFSSGVEQLIRSKYERKLYISKESPAPAVTTGNKSRSSHAPSPAGVVKEKKSSSGGKKTHSQQEQKKEQQVCVSVCVCSKVELLSVWPTCTVQFCCVKQKSPGIGII